MRFGRLGWASIALACAACATSNARPDAVDGGEDDAAGVIDDAGTPPPQEASVACSLGTVDHCGTCATVCPGFEDAGTFRTCSDSTSAATCGITCTGEFYDLDALSQNGCEAEDPIVHDSADDPVAQTATVAGITVPAPYWFMYGDDRPHAVAPVARKLGREDWYAVNHPDGALKVCLSIIDFPPDDQFEACVSNAGNKNIPTTGGNPCTTALGGVTSSNCVTPLDKGNQAGVYYVRVRKKSGSNTPNGYALFLQD